MNNVHSVNLLHFLRLRESNIHPGVRHPVPPKFLYHGRNFYRSVTPRCTVQNVSKPYGYLRKFSPDGRKLIAFSHDIRCIDIYGYQGVASVAQILNTVESEVVESTDESDLAFDLRSKLFDLLFEREFHIPLITTPTISKHFLNREFSLFVDNGRYIILGSVAGGSIFANYETYQAYADMYDETELYDYTFYLVDLNEGLITDTLKFQRDYMLLSHNTCVSLYDRTLAMFSIYRQCIEILEIIDGRFKPLFVINGYGNDSDRNSIQNHLNEIQYRFNPEVLLPLPHIKQRALVFLYREIMNLDSLGEKKEKLEEFYKNFAQIERTVIWRMQLIDDAHLLIRLEDRSSGMTSSKNYKLYVFYNFMEQTILRVFPQNSMELLKIMRNYADDLRNVHPLYLPWYASSTSNDCFSQKSFDKAIDRYGNSAEAISSLTAALPICSQSFTTSPYLDFSLFKYEERLVSAFERPKERCIEPIRVLDRITRQKVYRLFLDEDVDTDHEDYDVESNPSELVSFIFHPYEPFAISVQKYPSHHSINFHMYNSATKILH